MILTPSPIGSRTLTPEVLKADKKASRKFGPCGVGKEALYMGTNYIDRCFYIPWKEVKRVFKRVAMSQGAYTGKGAFGALGYLVVQFGNGKEKQSRFRHEAEIDRLLALVEKEHPNIPTHSAKAERKLADAEAAEEKRYLKELSGDAAEAVHELTQAKVYLEQRPSLSNVLAAAAKQKRIVDNIKPGYKIAGVVMGVVSVLAAIYGIYALTQHRTSATYFLLGAVALFFFALSSNMLPNKWNSKKRGQADWDDALNAMREYLAEKPDFPVPAQYAHPMVLERMIRVLREGKAKTAAQAYTTMKKELKALNSTVKVSQSEYDEVVKIKPLFLVCDYEDTI
ncbi:MAG: ATPase P [Oscillospiraceae bacterium]|nr:ATPase P [Oscillospiraceae bacterium]